MAWMRFPRRWLKPLLALNAVLVVYFVSSSKTKPETSSISETLPRREDVGSHSMGFFPNTWERLTNSKLYNDQAQIK